MRRNIKKNGARLSEAKNSKVKINSAYQDSIQEIQKIIINLQNGQFIDDAKKDFNGVRTNLDDNIRKINTHFSLESIHTPIGGSRISQPIPPYPNIDNDSFKEKDISKSTKLDKITTISLLVNFILLILVIFFAYSYFLGKDKNIGNSDNNNEYTKGYEYPSSEDNSNDNRNDNDYSKNWDNSSEYYLNENDTKLVNNQLELDKDKINDVVETIFKKNPSDVGRPYKDRRGEYTQQLYDNNTECFKIENNDTIITKPLMQIPKEKK